eukprot:m.193097 g.193097  ORF g.193097 m.193097 type:complete len:109 (+) comp15176_c0_seq8:1716-2042(+)
MSWLAALRAHAAASLTRTSAKMSAASPSFCFFLTHRHTMCHTSSGNTTSGLEKAPWNSKAGERGDYCEVHLDCLRALLGLPVIVTYRAPQFDQTPLLSRNENDAIQES